MILIFLTISEGYLWTNRSPLIISNFDKKIKKLNESQIFYCNKKNIALPIRIHDYKTISSIFPINNFELHLSAKEVYELSKKNFEIGTKNNVWWTNNKNGWTWFGTC